MGRGEKEKKITWKKIRFVRVWTAREVDWDRLDDDFITVYDFNKAGSNLKV